MHAGSFIGQTKLVDINRSSATFRFERLRNQRVVRSFVTQRLGWSVDKEQQHREAK